MATLKIEDKTLYDLPELSEKMGVGIETVRMYARSGKVRAVKVGRKYWVDSEELKRLFDTGTGPMLKIPKKAGRG